MNFVSEGCPFCRDCIPALVTSALVVRCAYCGRYLTSFSVTKPETQATDEQDSNTREVTDMRTERQGFTLIELVVVILIIGVLVGLISSAVFKAMAQVPKTQTAVEISSLQNGITSFMFDYGLTSPPPSTLSIHEDGVSYNVLGNPADALTVSFFKQTFGNSFNYQQPRDWNGNGIIDPPYILQGSQCLVFYLGGIPSYSSIGTVSMTGFSSSNASPDTPAVPNLLYPVASPSRRGPYFNFATARLANPFSAPGPYAPFADARCPNFPVYQDPWQAHRRNSSVILPSGIDQPYAYFSTWTTIGGGSFNTYSPLDCNVVGANVYYQGFNVGSIVPAYVNPNSFQIISAGNDGIFAFENTPTILGTVSWSPSGSFIPTPPATVGMDPQLAIAGLDDQSNFAVGTVGTGSQK